MPKKFTSGFTDLPGHAMTKGKEPFGFLQVSTEVLELKHANVLPLYFTIDQLSVDADNISSSANNAEQVHNCLLFRIIVENCRHCSQLYFYSRMIPFSNCRNCLLPLRTILHQMLPQQWWILSQWRYSTETSCD